MTEAEFEVCRENDLQQDVTYFCTGKSPCRIHEHRPEPIMRWFSFTHLQPGAPREMSKRFAKLAVQVCENAEPSAERTVALRKLLEGKDAAVRACLP